MKKTIVLLALLMLAAAPALAKDPNFDIAAYCKRTQAGAPAVALQNCIEEEEAVRDDVRAMDIPEAVFKKCLEQAEKNPDEANYYSFWTCAGN